MLVQDLLDAMKEDKQPVDFQRMIDNLDKQQLPKFIIQKSSQFKLEFESIEIKFPKSDSVNLLSLINVEFDEIKINDAVLIDAFIANYTNDNKDFTTVTLFFNYVRNLSELPFKSETMKRDERDLTNESNEFMFNRIKTTTYFTNKNIQKIK